jgi:hypothetical protein
MPWSAATASIVPLPASTARWGSRDTIMY